MSLFLQTLVLRGIWFRQRRSIAKNVAGTTPAADEFYKGRRSE
jgi:hypothetical protein